MSNTSEYQRIQKNEKSIKNNDIYELSKANYGELLWLQKTSGENYLQDLKGLHTCVEKSLHQKKKLQITFVVSFLSTWIGDKLIQLFLKDRRFEVRLLLVWQRNSDHDFEMSQLRNHFDSLNIPDEIADRETSLERTDIVFFTSPYLDMLEGKLDVPDIPLTTLVCYTG